MPRLSVILITHNEEKDLPRCLDSLKGVADEIVVVDSHSADRTRDIARKYTDKVFERDFAGYGPQKQFALEQASGEWILNLDADECLTPGLAMEIRTYFQKGDPVPNGFWIPYENYFLGRRLRFGGSFREHHLRLFRKSQGHYAGRVIHEGIAVSPPLGYLNGRIRHESYRGFTEYLEKCNEYTRLIAGQKFAQGRRFAAWHHLRLPWEFFVRYVVKLGFLDGQAGFVYAVLSAYYAWLKHVRLLDYERGEGI
ncbi:MAG TPA: glycosyltransferase family 2 protein [Elusimicrobiota bacterium]|nr:glycosyltransferase family 2 protein [Elusimicrobiota bacterium]